MRIKNIEIVLCFEIFNFERFKILQNVDNVILFCMKFWLIWLIMFNLIWIILNNFVRIIFNFVVFFLSFL